MNGVRRFLGGGSASPLTSPTAAVHPDVPTPPWNNPAKPLSISPASTPSPIKEIPTTQGLFIRKDRKLPPPVEPVAGPSSPQRKSPPDTDSEWTYLGSNGNGTSTNGSSSARGSGIVSTRDALLMSLLSSEAMVDSRGYEIMSAEDVDELKKEHVILSSRLTALERKLATEAKIRDAAVNLAKLNSPSNSPSSSPVASPKSRTNTRISKQTSEAVAAANRRVESAQREVWRVKERAAEIGRRLTEHRAGVLGAVVADIERRNSTTEGEDPDDALLLSPASSAGVGLGQGGGRFDGAHLFAGHEDAVVPGVKRRGPSRKELEALEEQLRLKEEELEGVRELARELEREKDALAMDVDRVAELEAQVQELEQEKALLEDEKAVLEDEKAALEGEKEMLEIGKGSLEEERQESFAVQEKVRQLEAEVYGLEQERAKVKKELERVKTAAELEAAALLVERASWVSERARLDEERTVLVSEKQQWGVDAEKWALEQQQWAAERGRWEQEREELQEKSKEEIDKAREGLRMLVQRYEIPLYSRDMNLDVLVDALGRHLETVGAGSREAETLKEEHKKLEDLLASEIEKRSTTIEQLESAREEIKALQTRIQNRASVPTSLSNVAPPEPQPSSPITFATDAASIVALLQPLWATLPSPEARASKFTSAARPFRPGTGSPITSSPTARNIASGTSSPNASISDMDVRALKGLYNPAQPDSPNSNTGTFSIEAFASRVGALVADDRALIERLIRFAQAHDLLKKNAERAQKLASESNAALETYQRQVRMLEERTMGGTQQLTVLQSDLRAHEDALERMSAEKRDVEMLAAEQAGTVHQLTEANATLSARALALAEDAARAQEEVRVLSEREQAQRIALMEEINMVQTENGKMRTQLRALGKM